MLELIVFIGVSCAISLTAFCIAKITKIFTAQTDRKCFLSALKKQYSDARDERWKFEKENDANIIGHVNRSYQNLVAQEAGILVEITMRFPEEYENYAHRIGFLMEKINDSVTL